MRWTGWRTPRKQSKGGGNDDVLVFYIRRRGDARGAHRGTPEVIFGFFTDPAKMVQWKGTEAMLDPRPGGTYRVNVTGREIARGEYLEITPYTRIVFTWGWEEGPITPGSTTVEVRLIPDGSAHHRAATPRRAIRRSAGVARRRLGALPAAPGDRRGRRRPGYRPVDAGARRRSAVKLR